MEPRRIFDLEERLIAFAVPVEYGHSFATYAQRRAGLRPFGHFHDMLAFQGGNDDFRAKSSLRK